MPTTEELDKQERETFVSLATVRKALCATPIFMLEKDCPRDRMGMRRVDLHEALEALREVARTPEPPPFTREQVEMAAEALDRYPFESVHVAMLRAFASTLPLCGDKLSGTHGTGNADAPLTKPTV